MNSSSMTTKGQITIPRHIRKQLNLHPGDKIGFSMEGDRVFLVLKHKEIEAAFGICRPKKTASLDDMAAAIKKRGGHGSR